MEVGMNSEFDVRLTIEEAMNLLRVLDAYRVGDAGQAVLRERTKAAIHCVAVHSVVTAWASKICTDDRARAYIARWYRGDEPADVPDVREDMTRALTDTAVTGLECINGKYSWRRHGLPESTTAEQNAELINQLNETLDYSFN